MTDLAVIAINVAIVALLFVLLRDLVGDLLRPWPEPREHHDFICPRCPCSYSSASALAMHWTAQHTDATAYWPMRKEQQP